VAPLYAIGSNRALPDRRIIEVILPDGEQHKTLSTASRVFDVLIANRIGRDAVLLALGGGVIGDLVGFVAACYQRGIAFVQIPTTLLAHVDSSVGGKTAVNHPGGKNMIGAFHQPQAVIADTESLRTLPDRELRAGLAEVIKYGLICDAQFFGWIEANIDALLARSPARWNSHLSLVPDQSGNRRRDEREQGERAMLNLGHTFGHAIESATGYVEWLHGEAVGTGLLIAADMSARMGALDALGGRAFARVAAAHRAAGRGAAYRRARAFDYMQVDKKVQAGRVRLILLEGLGKAVVTGDYPDPALQSTLAAHFG
jgi:3-dehydroquinate synthase